MKSPIQLGIWSPISLPRVDDCLMPNLYWMRFASPACAAVLANTAVGCWLLADKGYDAEALRRYCDRYRAHVRVAEGELRQGYALRQARNTCCGDDLMASPDQRCARVAF